LTISLTPEKQFKLAKKDTIRQVAKLVGMLIAYSVAIPLGMLYTRVIERNKADALKVNAWHFDSYMTLSDTAFGDINWWKLNLHRSSPVNRGTPTVTLTTDASFVGWGAEFNGQSTGGNWSLSELETANINFLELQAVYLGLGCFLEELSDKNVKIFSDNSTAIVYINNFGGTKSMSCNFKARQIWEMVISKHIWITAVHLPGVDTVTVDKESRIVRDETEWSLNSICFYKIKKLGTNLNIDLLPSEY
jgi:ribonuclease HI